MNSDEPVVVHGLQMLNNVADWVVVSVQLHLQHRYNTGFRVTIHYEAIQSPSPSVCLEQSSSPLVSLDQCPSPIVCLDQSPSPIVCLDQCPSPIVCLDQSPSPIVCLDQSPSPFVCLDHGPSPIVKNLLKNYRPISNLPFLSKILEKVVLHKLLSHLQENNLSNPFQSAYQAGCSTEAVLLRIVNDILSALDNDNNVLLLLDLSAAFDTLDHQILLSRLNSVLGIQSTALIPLRQVSVHFSQ